MKKTKDLINIVAWKEQKDGGVIMTYELTELGTEVFKKLASTKKKKFCPDFCNSQIMSAIRCSLKESKKNV